MPYGQMPHNEAWFFSVRETGHGTVRDLRKWVEPWGMQTE
jgi:hypothetical protein